MTSNVHPQFTVMPRTEPGIRINKKKFRVKGCAQNNSNRCCLNPRTDKHGKKGIKRNSATQGSKKKNITNASSPSHISLSQEIDTDNRKGCEN